MANRILSFVLVGQDKLTPVVRKAGKNTEESAHGITGAMRTAGLSFAGLGVVIGGVFAKALADSRSLNLTPLKVAAKNAGIAWSQFKPQIDAAGASMVKVGFTQGQTNEALTKLVTVTGSSKAALGALGTAADLARYKSISLTDASSALGRAASGNTRALKELGISTADLPKNFAKTGTAASRMDTVMGLLNKKIGGQASAAAQTLGGKINVLKAQATNFSANLGLMLIPMLSKLMTVLTTILVPIMRNKSAFAVLAAGISLFAITAKIAMTLFSTSVKAALVTSVVGIAILALTVAIVLLLTHWNQVWGAMRKVTEIVCNAVTGAAKAVWNWLKANWPLLLGILTGPIGIATILIIRNWDNIKNACVNAFNAVIGFFRALPGRILGAIGAVGSLLTHAGSSIIGGLLGGITGALRDIGSWVNNNIVQPIIGAVKRFFGISSPSTVMMGIGGHLISGLIKGLVSNSPVKMIGKIFGGMPAALGALLGKGLLNIGKLPGKALSALGSLGGKIGGLFKNLFGGGGGGVQRWAGLVAQVLAMFGQPMSLIPTVLRRMNQESGGNPNIQNNWDSNAMAGMPSQGLMQVIPPTFAAYAGPFASRGIRDPLANVYASFAYAISRYGSLSNAFNRAGGYATGTSGASRGWAWVGERGPELMHFGGGEQVAPVMGSRGGSTIIWTGDVVIRGHALASKQEIGREVADALKAFRQKGGNV